MIRLYTKLENKGPNGIAGLKKFIKDNIREQILAFKRPSFISGLNNLIKSKLKFAIEQRDEYRSLIGEIGEPGFNLRTQLGVEQKEYVDGIIDIWVNSVKVNATGVRYTNAQGFAFQVEITAVRTDFRDVLRSRFAKYFSENKKGQRTLVPWLEWLLLRGSELVVLTHSSMYVPGITEEWSRTDEAIMIEGGVWSVAGPNNINKAYTGIIDDNFCTRAIVDLFEKHGIVEDIEKLVVNTI